MLERGQQFKSALERSQNEIRFHKARFAGAVDLRFELPRILVRAPRENHRMPVAEEFDEFFRGSRSAPHFAGIGNDPERAENIMGIVGALPGDDALVNDVVGFADLELRALDEIREVAFKEWQIAVSLPRQSVRERMRSERGPQILKEDQAIRVIRGASFRSLPARTAR